MRVKPLVPLFAALALFLATSPAAAGEKRFSPLVQSYAGGWIDWQEGAIYGVGRGMPDMHRGSHPLARRAAKVIALQSILKIAAGIHIDERKTLQDLAAGSRIIELEALIQFTEHRHLWVEDVSRPYYETVLRAPITGIGGLTARLIHALKDQSLNRNLPATPLPDEDQPWLVLDARQADLARSLSPALFPRIVSQSGNTIYDSDRVETEALIARGMARYVTAAGPGNRLSSAAGRPEPCGGPLPPKQSALAGTRDRQNMPGGYIVKGVVSIRGDAGTVLVVSEEDARSIEAEDALSRILRRCRVIILMPHPAAGGVTPSRKTLPGFGPPLAPFVLPMPASAETRSIRQAHRS